MDEKKLAAQILDLLKAEFKDFCKEDHIWLLKDISEDIAREKILLETSNHPKEHERNLQHLAATIQGEIALRQIKLSKKALKIFEKGLTLIIKTILASTIQKLTT